MKKQLLFGLLVLFFLSSASALIQRDSFQNVSIPLPEDGSFFLGGTVADEGTGLLYYIASIQKPKGIPVESDIEVGSIDLVSLEKVSSYRIPGKDLAELGEREGWWTNGLALSSDGKLYSVLHRQRLSVVPGIGAVVEGGLETARVREKTFNPTPITRAYDYTVFEFPLPVSGINSATARRVTNSAEDRLDSIAFFNENLFSVFEKGNEKGFLVVNPKTGEQQFVNESRASKILSLSVSPDGKLFAVSVASGVKEPDKILVFDVSNGNPVFVQAIPYDPLKNGFSFAGVPTAVIALEDRFFLGTSAGFIETFYRTTIGFEPQFSERVRASDEHILALSNWRDRLLLVHGISDQGPRLASAVFDRSSEPVASETKTSVVEEAAAVQKTVSKNSSLEPVLATISAPLVLDVSFDSALAQQIYSKTGQDPYSQLQDTRVFLNGQEMTADEFLVSSSEESPLQIVIPWQFLDEKENKIRFSTRLPAFKNSLNAEFEANQTVFDSHNGLVSIEFYLKEKTA
jgi:hypothetical protein